MTIVLRNNKSAALTFNEMDGNFTDLDGRTTTIEGAYIKSVNGVTPNSSNQLTITTANVTEGANLYYTDARSRASISVTDSGGDGSLAYNSSTGVITYTGPSASDVRAHFSAGEGIDISSGAISAEDATTTNKGIASFDTNHFTVSSGAVTLKTDGIDDTLIDFGTGANQVSTADIPEQTNLYYTDARVTSRINVTSIDALSDVTLGTLVNGHGLVYNGGSGRIELAELPGAAGGQNNTGSNVGGAIKVFQGKAGVDLRFRTFEKNDGNIQLTENTDTIDIDVVPNPIFGNIQINSEANTIENISTNANIILAPHGTGTVDVSSTKITSVADPTGAQDAATKAYVDAQTGALDLTLGLAATSGAASTVATNQTLSILGTSNEIETAVSGQTITVGLPAATSITTSLAVPAATITTANVTTAIIDEVTISGNNISTNSTNANLVLLASGTGVVEVDSNIDMNSNKLVNVTDPGSAQDAATKAYADLKLALTGGTMSGAIAMGTAKITGMGDPGAAQDAATKAYVDTQVSGLSSDKINEGNSKVEVVDAGTGTITHTVDGVAELTIVAASSTFGGNIIIPNAGNIGSASDTDAIAIAAGGDVTVSQGLIVTGNLTVNGTTTTLNTAEMKVEDLNITLADGAADSAAANGAGITIDGAAATITYSHSGTKFVFNKPIDTGANDITTSGALSGTGAAITGLSGTNIASGTVAAARVATLNQDTTGTAAIATTVTVADEGTDTTCFPTFVTAGTGNLGVKTDSVLTYNSSNGTLGATTFVGALTGNASGSSGSCTGNSATATVATTFTVADEGTDATCFPVFATAATGNVGGKTDSVLTYNSSNGTLGATTFSGLATSAQYADMAEIYSTDTEYAPGTVVTVGGDAETTAATADTQYIAGVISTDPAYLMNSAAEGQPIALVGRVPVRVVGSITKGQPVFATHNGKASNNGQGPIVGIALETNSDLGEKNVECMLKV